MKSRTFPIVPEAFTFVVPLVLVSFIAAMFSFCAVSIFFAAAAIFVLWFFRNPERKIPDEVKGLVSPADGRILKIEEGEDEGGLSGRFRKISIFMNVFNVHVNRSPCAGIVKNINYYPGKFFSADLDKASKENERNSLLLTTDDGREILVIQVAGLVARRIVCWVIEDANLGKGERFGLIRFGSRLEVCVPPDTEITVSPGDRVTAGETTIGYLS